MPIYEFKCDTCRGVFEKFYPNVNDVYSHPCIEPLCPGIGQRIASSFSLGSMGDSRDHAPENLPLTIRKIGTIGNFDVYGVE